MDLNLAERMQKLTGSATREILKLTANPKVISFAGGLPGKDCLPEAQIRQVIDRLLSGPRASQLLQYGTTDGLIGARAAMTEYVKGFGIDNIDISNVIMLSGGQQALDLMCKAFLDKGDVCLVENPTYLAMLQIVNSYQGKAVGVAANSDGLDLIDLEKKILEYRPKLLYIVPTFSNPTGGTYTVENRIKIVELAAKYNVIVIEDDPYSKLRFEGEYVKSVKGLTNADNVVFVASFSKIISPGLRVAAAVGHKDIIRKLEICKQGVDVHTPNLTQAVVEEFIRGNLIEPHVKSVLPKYKQKKDNMAKALKKYMPAQFKFNNTEGGLFIWGEFDAPVDTVKSFPKAIERNVAYIYGNAFYADSSGLNTIRLNFSNATPEQIEQGVSALGEIFGELV